MQFKKTSQILLGLFLLAIIMRIIYYAEVRGQLLFQTLLFDAKYYDAWANRILAEGWLGKGIFFVSPLYAYFLAIIYKFGGNPTAVKFIQFGLGSLIPLLIYGIGRRLFNKRIAIIASLMSCFYGAAIFFEGFLLKTALEVILICIAFYLLLLAKDKKLNYLWFLSGAVVGLSVLAKDTTLLFVPLVLFWIYLMEGSFAKSKRPILFCLLGALLIIGSLTTRNVLVGKDFVLTTYGGGMNFHMGNFKDADGGLKEPDYIRIDPRFEEIDSRTEAERRIGRRLKPSEISSFWVKETIKEIKEDPGHFMNLIGRKTGLLFNKTGLSDNYQMTFFKRYSFFFRYVFLGFWPIAILGLSGIVFALRFPERLKERSLILLFLFSTSFLLILGHVIDRYREVLVPGLILFSAFFIDHTYQSIKDKKKFLIAASAGIALLFFILTGIHFPNFNQVPYADAYNQLGLLYHEKEDYEAAVREYTNAIEEREDHLWAIQNLADAYLRLGRVEESIVEYKKALKYRPEVLSLYTLLKKATEMKGLSQEEILKMLEEEESERVDLVADSTVISPSHALGMEYLMNKEYDKAIIQFQRLLESSPDSVNALINLGISYRQTGEFEKAISSYKRALEITPEAIPARYNLCMLLMSQERFGEALPNLEEIVTVFREYMITQFYLARAYEETGRLAEAIKEYQDFVSWAKDEPRNRWLVEQAKDKVWMLEKRLRETGRDQRIFFEGSGYE